MQEVTNDEYEQALDVIRAKERQIASNLVHHTEALRAALDEPFKALNDYRTSLPPIGGAIPTNFRNLVESLYNQVNGLITQIGYTEATITNELQPRP